MSKKITTVVAAIVLSGASGCAQMEMPQLYNPFTGNALFDEGAATAETQTAAAAPSQTQSLGRPTASAAPAAAATTTAGTTAGAPAATILPANTIDTLEGGSFGDFQGGDDDGGGGGGGGGSDSGGGGGGGGWSG
ncbi:MAG: hypothetical protein AAF667_05090 [Pseudomonadota bacterium]